MLYKIRPDASRSKYNPKQNPRPHADDIVDYTNVKSTDLVKIQLKDLSLNQSIGWLASSLSSTPTRSVDVHYV
jgi:hypothetical protein